jgi:hypothetical protein
LIYSGHPASIVDTLIVVADLTAIDTTWIIRWIIWARIPTAIIAAAVIIAIGTSSWISV